MKLKNKLLSAVTAAVMGITAMPVVSVSAAYLGEVLTVNIQQNQQTGSFDGYCHDVWVETTGGSGFMILGEDGAFEAEWDAVVSNGSFLAYRGLDFGAEKKATEYGDIVVDYDASLETDDDSDASAWFGAYGRLQGKGYTYSDDYIPNAEYYIIEDWCGWLPDYEGEVVTIDGAEYKIFQVEPGVSINGDSDPLYQYFSIRLDERTSGTINVSEHFKAWEAEGWKLGNLENVTLTVNGWQSSGSASVSYDISYDEAPSTDDPAPETVLSVNPNQNEYIGSYDGYSHEIWVETTGASGFMTLGEDGAFETEWVASMDRGGFLAYRGLDFGAEKKPTEYGDIVVDYDASLETGNHPDGSTWFGAYGRLKGKGYTHSDDYIPNAEYYIIEDWCEWVPDYEGEVVTIDGAEYKIFQIVPGVSINGNPDQLYQYFSIRLDERTSGTINVSEHFKAWEAAGWKLGNLENVMLGVNAWQSNGKASVSYDISYEETPSTTTATTTPVTTTATTTTVTTVEGQKVFDVNENCNTWKGENDGYSYEVWMDTLSDCSGNMTLGDGACFKAEWDVIVHAGNFLAHRGKEYGGDRKATEYDDLVIEYDADFEQTASADGNSRLEAYGKFTNVGEYGIPVEFYIIENWVEWVPTTSSTDIMTALIDGAEYKVFKQTYWGPTIIGDAEPEFMQYFAIRQKRRNAGTINVSEHFKAWEELGLEIGNLDSLTFGVEAWQSAGAAEIHLNGCIDCDMEHETTTTTTKEIGPGCVLSVDPENRICDGYSEGYMYEMITGTSGGENEMTLGEDCCYSAKWDMAAPYGSFTAYRGTEYDGDKKATEYDDIILNYEACFEPHDNNDGYAFIGVHGLLGGVESEDDLYTSSFPNVASGQLERAIMPEPLALVEYFIVEDWYEWVPDAEGEIVTIDGAEYKVFRIVNGGSQPYRQYYSVRQDKRTSGSINVSEHFKAWEAQGWVVNELYSVTMGVEAYQSTGSVSFRFDGCNDCDAIHATEPAETTTTQQPEEVVLKGDANCDGERDISDVILVARIAAEDTAVRAIGRDNLYADCDDDNKITAKDAMLILRAIAKLIEL